MTKQQDAMLTTLQDLAITTDILIKGLSDKDLDKAHEAVSILLMQGMDFFGAESPAMQQFFPVWDSIKSHIDRSDVPLALGQARTWKAQLHEVISLVKQG